MLYKYTEKEDSGQLSSVGSVSNSISSFTSLGSTNGSWDEQEQVSISD
jgi:hypothetical protein